MLALSIIAVLTALLASLLSRSGLKWSLLLAAGLGLGFTVGTSGLHAFLFVVDLALLMLMIGMRQVINQWWQDGVICLQIMITTVYLVFTVFSGRAEWLTGASIDTANLLFLMQAGLMTLGGLYNSVTNALYIQKQRREGEHLPFLPTAWRMS